MIPLIRILLPFALILLFASSSSAEIFRWVDEKGKTHFTDDRSKIPQNKVASVPTRTRSHKKQNISLNRFWDIYEEESKNQSGVEEDITEESVDSNE